MGEKMSTSDGSTRKHSHYHKDVGHLLTMDVYRLCERFEINDPSGATQHAIKKLVCAGQRGSKGLLQDLQEAVDTINRRIEMIYEDQARDALLSTAFGQQNMIDPADVEISEHPSFEFAPDWANWTGQDADGTWYWFSAMPQPFGNGWATDRKHVEITSVRTPNKYWFSTLAARPIK